MGILTPLSDYWPTAALTLCILAFLISVWFCTLFIYEWHTNGGYGGCQ